MAASNSHLIGQLIGNWLEEHVSSPIILACINSSSIPSQWFLDSEGPRPARSSTKVAWGDNGGNLHNLEHVIEHGGSRDNIGSPAAFIESAWRSYKKHSKAKAQEIEGAIMPVSRNTVVSIHGPFLGAIIAGRWTRPSIAQLQSNDFIVLEFTHSEIISAFNSIDINVDFNEDTTVEELEQILEDLSGIGSDEMSSSGQNLLTDCSGKIDVFSRELLQSLDRTFTSVEVFGGPVLQWMQSGGEFPQVFDEGLAEDTSLRRWDLRVLFSDERIALSRGLTLEEINLTLNEVSNRYPAPV